MPPSPKASKRELSVTLACVKAQEEANEAIVTALKGVARDSDISKGILSRPFWGRLRWLLQGR